MDQTSVAKKAFDSYSYGRRQVERSRLRWLEEVENDLQELNVERWKGKANNSEEWACSKNEGKVL
jgi:hypothetical protein